MELKYSSKTTGFTFSADILLYITAPSYFFTEASVFSQDVLFHAAINV